MLTASAIAMVLVLGGSSPILIRADTRRHSIYVPARINGSSLLWFVLDSGGGYPWIVDLPVISQLGLHLGSNETTWGTGENPVLVNFVEGIPVHLSDLTFLNQTLAVTSLKEMQQFAGREMNGIIGYELFHRFVVEIEYENGSVALHQPETYSYAGSGVELPVSIEDNRFYTKAKITIDGVEPIVAKFLVDTGAGQIAVALTRPFVESHQLLRLTQGKVRHRLHAGLGGVTMSSTTNARFLEVGTLQFRDVLVDLSRDETGLLASSAFDGVLGGDLLSDFKVIFDYSRRRVILEQPGNRPFATQ